MYKQWQTGTSLNSAIVITLPVVLTTQDCTLSIQAIKCFTTPGLVVHIIHVLHTLTDSC